MKGVKGKILSDLLLELSNLEMSARINSANRNANQLKRDMKLFSKICRHLWIDAEKGIYAIEISKI